MVAGRIEIEFNTVTRRPRRGKHNGGDFTVMLVQVIPTVSGGCSCLMGVKLREQFS